MRWKSDRRRGNKKYIKKFVKTLEERNCWKV
jgi:hypothetical protein